MTCWFCHRPVIVPSVVNDVKADTAEVNINVRMTEQKVRCNSCGAGYTIECYLDNRPTVSDQMLGKLNNKVHP